MIYYEIYCTINKLNEKTYIGQHKKDIKKYDYYLGGGKILKQAIDKYGKDNFIRTILEVCYTKNEADFLEKKYIKFYRLGGKAEYNIADGGEGGQTRRGMKNTKEKNEKTANKNRGKLRTKEQRERMSNAAKGKIVTKETRQKQSEQRKGIPKSIEHRRKMSEAAKIRWQILKSSNGLL